MAARWLRQQAVSGFSTTKLDNAYSFERLIFGGKSNFFTVSRQKPTPFNYLILRLLNLTVMRVGFLNGDKN